MLSEFEEAGSANEREGKSRMTEMQRGKEEKRQRGRRRGRGRGQIISVVLQLNTRGLLTGIVLIPLAAIQCLSTTLRLWRGRGE
jgi:hypothetical protein